MFAALLEEGGETIDIEKVDGIIEQRGLALVADSGELDGVIAAVIEQNPQPVEDFRNGKQAAIGRLIGQAMREMKGADPQVVRQMLIDKISAD